MSETSDILGLMAEFDTPDKLTEAARRLTDEGFEELEAFTPFPVENLNDILDNRAPLIPIIVFVVGMGAASLAFAIQYWSWSWDYPINVGGRPMFSWPAYVPVTFEVGVLSAAFAAFFGMLFLNRLPLYHHPTFEVPGFERVTSDRFFMMVGCEDECFERVDTRELLLELDALAVSEVPCE